MAKTFTPPYPQTIKNAVVRVNNASGTTLQTLRTASAEGDRVDTIMATSTDTSNRDFGVYLTIGGTDYLIGTVQIPATAGFVNNVPTVDVLRAANMPGVPLDAYGNRCLLLASGTVLKVGALVAVTAAKQVDFFAPVGEY